MVIDLSYKINFFVNDLLSQINNLLQETSLWPFWQ